MTVPLLTGFESTFQPAHDRDVAETTGHDRRWRSDLELVRAAGVDRLRYPVRWHRVEAEAGRFDWSEVDEVLAHLRDRGMRPIVDLVHHTSYPRWLSGGFGDRRFGASYVRFVEAFFLRHPDIEEYTLFNEPFSTLFLGGHEAIWPPYRRGVDGFASLLRNVLPAIGEAAQIARDLAPAARHVWVDSCEHHHGRDGWGVEYAEYANDRRFVVLDLLVGRIGDLDRRPFLRELVSAGGGGLLELTPIDIDVLGLDYYAHCQWDFEEGANRVPARRPTPLADQIAEYAARYGRPAMVTETNLRGTPSDRATWLKYVLEQCEVAVDRGVDLQGCCWFPFVDSADWSSLLARCDGDIDPVGVVTVADGLDRVSTTMSAAFTAAAHGGSAAVPAYRWQEPAAGWLAGYLPHVPHWDWRPPPTHDVVDEPEIYEMELAVRDA